MKLDSTAATAPARHFPERHGGLVHVRRATTDDLGCINAIVGAAMRTWRLSERAIRLSLPLYRYDSQDFEHQHLLLAEGWHGAALGMAAMETADPSAIPGCRNAALLHGIYIDPGYHRHGIGSALLARVEDIARSLGFEGKPGGDGLFRSP